MKSLKKLKDKSEDNSDSDDYDNGDDDDDEHREGGETGDYDDGEIADHSKRKHTTSFQVFQTLHNVSVPLDQSVHPKSLIKSTASKLTRAGRRGAQHNSGSRTQQKPQLLNVVSPISFRPNKPLTLRDISTTNSKNNTRIPTVNSDNQQPISDPPIETAHSALTDSIVGLGGTAYANISIEVTKTGSSESVNGQKQLHVDNNLYLEENVTSDWNNHGSLQDATNLQNLSFSDINRVTEVVPNKEIPTAKITDNREISFTGVTMFQSFVSSTLEFFAGQSRVSSGHNLNSSTLTTIQSVHPKTEGMVPKIFEKPNVPFGIMTPLSGSATRGVYFNNTRSFGDANPDRHDSVVSARLQVQNKYKDFDQQMASNLDKELPLADTFCHDLNGKNPRGKEIKCCENAIECFNDLRETLKTVTQSGYNGEVSQACNSMEEDIQMQTKCIQKVLDKCDKETRDILRDKFESKMQLLSSHVQKQCYQDISTDAKVMPPKLQASAGAESGVNNVPFIVGSVLGGVIFLAIIIAILFVWARKKREESSRGVKQPWSLRGNASLDTERRDSVIYEEIDERFVSSANKYQMEPKYAMENRENNNKMIRISTISSYLDNQRISGAKPDQADTEPLPESNQEYENNCFENTATSIAPERTKENQYENAYELPKTNSVREDKKVDMDTKMTMNCLKSDIYENINSNVNRYESFSSMSTNQHNDIKFIESQGSPNLTASERKGKEADNELPHTYLSMESQSKL